MMQREQAEVKQSTLKKNDGLTATYEELPLPGHEHFKTSKWWLVLEMAAALFITLTTFKNYSPGGAVHV